MGIGHALKWITFGLVMGLLAIGLLPFLAVYSFAEMVGAVETSEWLAPNEGLPLWLLPMRFRRRNGRQEKSGQTEGERAEAGEMER